MTQTQHRADHELQNAIADELVWTPSVDAEQIGVAVTDGAATLTGTVGTYPEKEEALRAATRVHGVTVTGDQIVVQHKGGIPQDADLAREAAIVFDRRTVVIPRGSVQVEVQDHVLTLRGSVAWQYQREAARHAIAMLPGVSGVRNLIVVKPSAEVTPAETQGRIAAALRRHAPSGAQHVEVEVTGSQVTLTGTASSSTERRQAEQAAWFATGVTAVDNQVTLVG
ncbi:BON domain-containing protein [Amycolatopsis carbonis]|uniref:BON domain-containing protein n=1 Tax=Amycolatopsis carbonis TaxID=715471 RepID=A0A9Y2I7S7_9PSEU|nr:BON domain-containing protein [Amycolatopsis sp. 2-15]WIX75142.1 BON domain-containing protein [Amycolatopsis sp. 2-15]